MEENSLQSTISKLYRKIPGNIRLSMVFTFLIGFITNIFIFTNKCINHDDLMAEFIINTDFDITSGRWTWPVLRRICSYYDMPLIKGLMAMLLLAITSGLIISVLGIKDKIYIILISAVLGTYPINACFFSYMGISEIYYFAILFAVLGVFFVDKHKIFGPLIAAIFICLSLATYQSFLCFTIGLVFVMAFVELLDKEFRIKKWIIKYCKYAVTAGMGYVFYFIGTKIILQITDNSLRSYAGTDKMFTFDLASLRESIRLTYETQKEFYFTTQIYQHRLFAYANKAIAAVFIIIVVCKLINSIKNKKWANTIALVVMTIITPMLLNFIYIMMNGKSTPHMLMKYSTILPYIMILALVGHSRLLEYVKLVKVRWILQAVASLGCVVAIYYGILISNQLYLRMYYNTNAIDSMTTGLVTKVSMVEDWTVTEPIFFANFDSFFNQNYLTIAPFSSELLPYTWTGTDIYPWYSANHMIRYINFYQHLNLVASNYAPKQKEIMETEEFKEMPIYPSEGSIKRIDGLLVVKFANQ